MPKPANLDQVRTFIQLLGASDKVLRPAAREVIREDLEAFLSDPGDDTPDELVEEVRSALEAEPAEDPEPEAEPVAASVLKPRSEIRKPADAQPKDDRPRGLVAAAVGTEHFGEVFQDRFSVNEALVSALRHGRPGDQVVARAAVSGIPKLGRDAWENLNVLMELREGVAAAREADQGLVAAGFCAPAQPIYEFFGLGGVGGIIDLPEVEANRGRVTRENPITVPDLEGQAGIGSTFTAADDEAGTTKDCFSVTCGEFSEFEVAAEYVCLRASNFDSVFYPEKLEHLTRTALAVSAHVTNARLISDIVTSPETSFINDLEDLGGAWVTFTRAIARTAAAYREREKMPVDALLELVVPSWFGAALAADTTARDSSSIPNLIPSLTEIAAELRNLAVRVQFVHDWQGPDQSGAFDGFVSALLFAPGAVVRMRGSTIDLGVVRDHTLNLSNEMSIFHETFDGIVTLGPIDYISGIPSCPTGATGSRVSIVCAGS